MSLTLRPALVDFSSNDMQSSLPSLQWQNNTSTFFHMLDCHVNHCSPSHSSIKKRDAAPITDDVPLHSSGRFPIIMGVRIGQTDDHLPWKCFSWTLVLRCESEDSFVRRKDFSPLKSEYMFRGFYKTLDHLGLNQPVHSERSDLNPNIAPP